MIIIYFKDPAISLVMGGELNDDLVESIRYKLNTAGKGPVLEFKNPEGRRAAIFPDSGLDIAYMMEITEEEWQAMKRNRDAARARSTIIPPPGPVPKIPKKN